VWPLFESEEKKKPPPQTLLFTGVMAKTPVKNKNQKITDCPLPPQRQGCSVLGTSAYLQKAGISFVTSVFLSIHKPTWNNSAPTGLIFMKFDIQEFFNNLSRKFKFC